MALNQNIIHFLIIDSTDLPVVPTRQQRMILCKDTGQIYWEDQGLRFAAGGSNIQADWNLSDSSDPAYIKNKPSIPSNLLSRLTALLNRGLQIVTLTSDMLSTELSTGNIIAATGNSRLPVFVCTADNTCYTILSGTVKLAETKLNIIMNRYMAYLNQTTTPIGWKIIYA